MFYLPGKTVLQHNPRALRAEWNFHLGGGLELWFSPLAGESLSMADRNFSCRDDAMRVFDRIRVEGWDEASFAGCDYDMFHVVFHRRDGARLESRLCLDRPACVLWSDREWVLELKTDRQDHLLEAGGRVEAVEHPDRGRRFHFVAVAGRGARVERTTNLMPTGRSRYARMVVPAGVPVVLAADLASRAPLGWARRLAARRPQALVAADERRISARLRGGSFTLADPDLQRLLDKNRRWLLAMQDESGAIRAAVNRIYYMIWVRDGSIIESMQAYAGVAGPLGRWVDFLLANPTHIKKEEPRGRTFGMLCGDLNKWEEDGVFYAVWSVFTAWTQTGEERFRAPAVLRLLRAAIDWLDRYCHDPALALYGRYYACENPLAGSRDDGFDNAMGCFMPRSALSISGRLARRSYDLYINLGQHAVMRMMAALDPARSRQWNRRADQLAAAVEPLLRTPLPDYGRIEVWPAGGGASPAAAGDPPVERVASGREFALAGPVGLDLTDYVWGLTLLPFQPRPERFPAIRRALLERARREPRGWFLAGYFSLLQSLDPLWMEEEEILSAVRYAAAQCHRPGERLPMADSVVEMLEIRDGDPWHDVRPQAFSVGPWLATMTGLVLRRLPFGLAVRAGEAVSSIRGYEWRGARLDLGLEGCGRWVGSVEVEGCLLEGTWQIPSRLLRRGLNRVRVVRSAAPPAGPVLAGGTAELLRVSRTPTGGLRYRLRAFGEAQLVFLGLGGRVPRVAGAPALRVASAEGLAWVCLKADGEFDLDLG